MPAPSVDALRGFLLGSLTPNEAERVALWVEANPDSAADALRELSASDAFTAEVSATLKNTPQSGESQLVDRVIQIVTQSLQGMSPVATVPERVGDYRVVRELGRGGMGVVYEAVDDKLGRRVALKLMIGELAGNETARQRFLREARAAAALKSDHVVTIYQVGEVESVPFLAMEYLEGTTLDDWLKDRSTPVGVREVLWVARDVLAGLSAVHAKGLIHRDIKPSNLWIEKGTGRVKLLDFGLTRGAGGGDVVTREGAVVGTPAYMAPEQASGKTIDPRADLFSVGVVLYRTVTARSPFQRDSLMATLSALATEEPAPVDSIAGMPKPLAAFIGRLMSKDPAARPADAKAALAELATIECPTEEIAAFAKSSQAKSVPAPHRPRRRLLEGVGLLAVALAIAASVLITLKTADGSIAVTLPEGNVAVFIDGKEQAAVEDKPLVKLSLKSGKHRFTVKREGKEVYGVDFEVKPGETTEWTAEYPIDTKKAQPTAEQPAPPDAGSPNSQSKPLPPQTKEPRVPYTNPLDALDASLIPSSERFPWQPKGLVAVIGKHRQRLWRSGHSSMSPDGKRLAVQGSDNIIYIWDVPSQREMMQIGPAESFLAFSFDSRRVYGSSSVWDISAPIPKRLSKRAARMGGRAQFSADGKTAIDYGDVSAGTIGFVTVWNVNGDEWERRCQLSGTSDYSLSPDGKTVAIAMEKTGIVKLYSIAGREPKENSTLPKPTMIGSRESTLAFVANDRLVTVNEENVLRLWDVGGREPHQLDEGKSVGNAIVAAPGTNRACTWQGNKSVNAGYDFWDVSGDQLKQFISGSFADRPVSNLISVALAPDGRVLVTYHMNGAICSWNVTDKILVERQPIPIQPYFPGSKLSFNGRCLLTRAEEVNNTPELWDLGTTRPMPVVDQDGLLSQTWHLYGEFAADNSSFTVERVSGGQIRALSVFKANRGNVSYSHDLPFRQPFILDAPVSFSQDGEKVLFVTNTGVSVNDVKLDPARKLGEVEVSFDHYVRLFSRPDGSRFVLGGRGGMALYAIADGQIKQLAKIPMEVWARPVLSPNGMFLLVPKMNSATVHISDLTNDTLHRLGEFTIPGADTIESLHLLPDNRTLAFGSTSGVVGMYDIEKKSLIEGNWWQFPGPVRAVTASTDGRYLITGNNNGTIYVIRLSLPYTVKQPQP